MLSDNLTLIMYLYVPEKIGFYLSLPEDIKDGDKVIGTTKLNNVTFTYPKYDFCPL